MFYRACEPTQRRAEVLAERKCQEGAGALQRCNPRSRGTVAQMEAQAYHRGRKVDWAPAAEPRGPGTSRLLAVQIHDVRAAGIAKAGAGASLHVHGRTEGAHPSDCSVETLGVARIDVVAARATGVVA